MKKVSVIILSIVVIISLIVVCLFSFVHNATTDRVNPFITKTTSYAKVEKGTQHYKDVKIYDKNGKQRGYTLTFDGYDPDQQYVKIKHKGRYVQKVLYLKSSSKQLPRNLKEAK